jgi:capsular polysaccharide biosynthesis protein
MWHRNGARKRPDVQPGDYIRVLRKRWPGIIAIAVIAVIASYVFTRLQTPIYRAAVFLTVSPSRIDYGQTLSIENLLRQYARQLQTERLADEVNQRLKLDLPTEVLRAKVRVAAVSEDLLLTMEVDDTDANRARDIAFAWADEFVKLHQNRMAAIDPRDRIEIDLLDKPAPALLNWPKRTQIMLAAGLLALLVGFLGAFVLEFLDDTIRTAEDVDRLIGRPILAVVPAADSGPTRARGMRAWFRRDRSLG